VSINGVSTATMTHSDAVQLIQNSSSPLHLLMRSTKHAQTSDHLLLNTATGTYASNVLHTFVWRRRKPISYHACIRQHSWGYGASDCANWMGG